MGADGVPMLFGILTGSAIGGAAFDDGAFERIDEVSDEFGLEVVMAAHLAGGDLDADVSAKIAAEDFIDSH